MTLRLYLASFAALVAFVWIEGCGSLGQPKVCGEIPASGCPIGRGGTCDDVACDGLYDCVDGAWTLATACSHDRDGGSDASGGGGDAGDGGPCTPVMFDHMGETKDCMPDLQEPDCPAEVAEGCAERACTTGCIDFFLCLGGAWTDVAFCDDNGDLVITQK